MPDYFQMLKNFARTILESVLSIEFYHRLIFFPLKASIYFYLCFLLVAVGMQLIPLYFSTIPRFEKGITGSLQELQTHYPDDLVLTWDGSTLQSTHPELPVYYPTPLKEALKLTKTNPYLAYFNASSSTTPRTDADFLVSSTEVLIPNSDGEITEVPIIDILGTTHYTITPSVISEIKEYWNTNKNAYLLGVQLGLPIVLYIALFLQRIIMLALESLLFYLFKKIQGGNWTYGTAIKYALHIFVPAEIVGFAAQYLYPNASFSFFSLTVWIYFIVISFVPQTIRFIKVKR